MSKEEVNQLRAMHRKLSAGLEEAKLRLAKVQGQLNHRIMPLDTTPYNDYLKSDELREEFVKLKKRVSLIFHTKVLYDNIL